MKVLLTFPLYAFTLKINLDSSVPNPSESLVLLLSLANCKSQAIVVSLACSFAEDLAFEKYLCNHQKSEQEKGQQGLIYE